MGKTGYYSPLFTGSMADPQFGVRIANYPAFEALMERENIHPKVEWDEEEPDAYPQVRYAYLYGFQHPDEDVWLNDAHETFSLRNVAYAREQFWSVWTAVATTCEPFAVLHPATEYGSFPSVAEVALGKHDAIVYRIECEPGEIRVITVSLTTGEETIEETHTWNPEEYLRSRDLDH